MPTEADSIYQPPASDVDRPQPRAGDFGSIDRALSGDFAFGIQDVMSEAWQLVRGSKGVIVGGFVLLYAVTFAAGFLMAGLGLTGPQADSPWAGGLLQIVVGIFSWAISAGMIYYGIKRAAHDRSATFADVFSYFPILLPMTALYLFQTILTLVGFAAFVVPGIYLAVSYLLASALLLDKRLGVWESLETSRKAITKIWFPFFGLMLIAGLATAVGTVLTLGIAGIWLGPWSILCLGVAYRKVFGYGPEPA